MYPLISLAAFCRDVLGKPRLKDAGLIKNHVVKGVCTHWITTLSIIVEKQSEIL